MNNNINQHNEHGQRHGYWEEYHDNGQLMYKGNYVNGEEQGYFIEYWNKTYYKFFYKNGKRHYKNRKIGILKVINL